MVSEGSSTHRFGVIKESAALVSMLLIFKDENIVDFRVLAPLDAELDDPNKRRRVNTTGGAGDDDEHISKCPKNGQSDDAGALSSEDSGTEEDNKDGEGGSNSVAKTSGESAGDENHQGDESDDHGDNSDLEHQGGSNEGKVGKDSGRGEEAESDEEERKWRRDEKNTTSRVEAQDTSPTRSPPLPPELAPRYDETAADQLDSERDGDYERGDEGLHLLELIDKDATDDAADKALSCSLLEAVTTTVRATLAHKSEDVFVTTNKLYPGVSIDALKQSSAIQPPNFGLVSKCSFFPYQLVFTSGAFVQERTELLGGILGDEPGGGKTRQSLGLWTTHIHHINNYFNVTSFWEHRPLLKDDKHCDRDAPPDAKCPMQEKLPIARWCSPRNREELYNNKEPTGGITLLITPSTGIPSYSEEICKMFKDSQFTDTMYGRPGQIRPRIAFDYDKIQMPDYPPLTSAKMDKVCVKRAGSDNKKWQAFLASQNQNEKKMTVKDKGQHNHRHNLHGGVHDRETQLEDSAGVLLVMSRESIPTRIMRKYYSRLTAHCKYPPRLIQLDPGTYPKGGKEIELNIVRLDIGRLWWDECHVGAGGDSTIVKLMEEQRERRIHPSTVWGGSGTPGPAVSHAEYRVLHQFLAP